MNKIKIKTVELFAGISMTLRGIQNTDCFEPDPQAICENDINAIIANAATHYGLTPKLIETYPNYPSRQEMVDTLVAKNIGYDFIKDKPYNWQKLVNAVDSKNQLKKIWLADHITNNLGDITKVDEIPPCGLVTWSFPCFAGNTKIQTLRKNGHCLTMIKDIKAGDVVLTDKGYWAVTNVYDNGIHNVGDLTFSDGYKVSCTPDHKFLCVIGGIQYWKKAKDITSEDIVLACSDCIERQYKTLSVVSFDNFRDEHVYDIEVYRHHLFCLENGVIVKNCTDLSISGKQSGMSEGKTRSGLAWEVLRILKNMKVKNQLPNFLLMENVDALVSKKFINDYENLNQEFAKLGYDCKWQVINAKNCGVPQNRKRCFAVYALRDKIDLSAFEFPKPFDKGIRLKDVLEDEVDEKYYINNERTQELIKNLVETKPDLMESMFNEKPE